MPKNQKFQPQTLPWPVASIVRLELPDDEGQRRLYLIEDQSVGNGVANPKYSLYGHSDLGTQGTARAWIEHRLLTLVELPSYRSWTMLHAALNGDDLEDEDKEADEENEDLDNEELDGDNED